MSDFARVSQTLGLGSTVGKGVPKSSQTLGLGSTVGKGVPRSSQIVALMATAPPSTKRTLSAQQVALASTETYAVPRSSQIVALVAWRTGALEEFRSRAWTFTLDGHPFYVLSLGNVGTFVYDLTTGEWSQWATGGLQTWNMENGVVWRGEVYAGDNQNPLVWRLDPDSFLDDDFKPITRVVTGGFPARQRVFARQGSLTLTASVGAPQTTPATVTLRFSDDAGRTWREMPPVTLEPEDFSQEVAWRSLGAVRAPGRVFEISDFGALVRIDGLDADIEGAEEPV